MESNPYFAVEIDEQLIYEFKAAFYQFNLSYLDNEDFRDSLERCTTVDDVYEALLSSLSQQDSYATCMNVLGLGDVEQGTYATVVE